MGPTDIFLHLLSFAAPALALSFFMVLATRVLLPQRIVLLSWWAQVALNAVLGIAVLALGLWRFGVDGKMATYAALVVVTAASQWVGIAGWRH
jgi:ABC-type Fe3+-hydroxamate transport system substrate-binding protein